MGGLGDMSLDGAGAEVHVAVATTQSLRDMSRNAR